MATLRWGVICRFQAERHLSGQTPSVELAAIGRRVSETEWDVLDLLEGDARASGDPMSSLYGRPTAAELVAAVADFLDTDVRDATDGQVSFHARVAANVLRIVERELLDQTAGEVPRPDRPGLRRRNRAGGRHPRRRARRQGRRGAAVPTHAGAPPAYDRPPGI